MVKCTGPHHDRPGGCHLRPLQNRRSRWGGVNKRTFKRRSIHSPGVTRKNIEQLTREGSNTRGKGSTEKGEKIKSITGRRFASQKINTNFGPTRRGL